MIVPRRLYSTVPYEQTTAETLRAEGEEDRLYLVCAEGTELHDQEATRLGIVEYLKSHPVQPPEEAPAEEKAVEQATTEDKAVAGPSEEKTEDTPAAKSPEEPTQPGEVHIGRGGRRGV